jgi:hypothetical protein
MSLAPRQYKTVGQKMSIRAHSSVLYLLYYHYFGKESREMKAVKKAYLT